MSEPTKAKTTTTEDAIGAFVALLFLVVFFLLVGAGLWSWIWNDVIHSVFGLPTLTWQQSLGIIVLIGLTGWAFRFTARRSE